MKLNSLILSLVLLLLLTSCAIKESVVFNQDNSGQIKYGIDMSQLMSMGDMFGDKKEKSEIDSEGIAEKTSKKIDSVFSMKEILELKKDSITTLSKEEQEKLKKLERFTIHFLMDEENNKMEYEMYVDFDNIKEFTNLGSPLNALSELNPTGTELPKNDMAKNDSETNYYFNGNKFSKKVTKPQSEVKNVKENKVAKKSKKDEKTEEESLDGLASKMNESIDMMMSQSNYVMTVTFPKKVKKISAKNATLSEDKKTVTITYSMDDYMKSNGLNFDVELEK